MTDLFILSHDAIAALAQVIMIDLVLAGDNAVVIGLAAAGLAQSAARARDPGRHRGGDRAAHVYSPASPSNCCGSSACCWPAAFCCSGSPGRCGANCAGQRRTPRGSGRRQAPRKTFAQAAWQIVRGGRLHVA